MAGALVAAALVASVPVAAAVVRFGGGPPVGSPGCQPVGFGDSSATSAVGGRAYCEFQFGGGPHATLYEASAGFGSLGAAVTATLFPLPGFTPMNLADAGAEFIADYVFSTTGNVPGGGGLPGVKIALDFSGSLGVTSTSGSSSAGVRVDVTMAGQTRTFSQGVRGDGRTFQSNSFASGLNLLALIGDTDVDIDLVSGDFFNIPLNRPVSVGIRLGTHAYLVSDGSGLPSTGRAEFGSTLTFDADGPVFILPAGYTVNGPGVVDNRWVATPRFDVPEPGGLALAGLALAALAGKRRPRRHTPA